MAENQMITTSSKGLNERNAHILLPHNGAVRKLEHERKSSEKQSFHEDMGKNKLKRKKKLSASLTSVGDAVNQEKRTRIEGINLNIKPRYKDHNGTDDLSGAKPAAARPPSKVERPVIIGGINVLSAAPQRFKRKLQENLDTIQKLNALAEQLRLEVNELKSSLITERGAVRALRAQNDADSRKWRTEVKKLQQTLETTRKSNGTKKPNELASAEAGSGHVAADGLINYEIQRLTNEIAMLKEANKTKEEKTQLEEIKTKERNIGQLQKDLQTLQNGKKHCEARTKPKTNESSQKLKKPTTKTATATTTTITIATTAKNETDIKDTLPPNPLHLAQVTTEITQLKNIELINNTKNAHKSKPEMRTTKATSQQQMQQQQMNHQQIMTGKGTTATTWMEALPPKAATMEYRTKDHNSDTDSALSSAPPSISPQPPSSGADSGVMWQALQDLDKLQKEVEIYHKENQRLQTELQLIKQELVTAEKAALSASNNHTHINELLQRIKDLEEEQVQLNTEASELREQNELLEFRILELEDDKMDGTCADHCLRLENLLRKTSHQLEEKDKRCLQQLLLCVQQLDLEAIVEPDTWQATTKAEPRSRHSRIVATVQPYSNSATPTAPTTPSKQLQRLQNSSLTESGVFVECDLSTTTSIAEHPHLQYYQERLIQLESKLLVYESSGETQAKHLAERLQRELQLNKQVKELSERVELLVEQNALLDEAKCEFEEAENDTRFHLQRNEEELEILRQRNVELEFGKDALAAKYRDCRAECLILRDDLCAAERQLEHLQAERQRVKQQLESLYRSLPLLLICRLLQLARISAGGNRSTSSNMGNEESLPRRAHAGATGACKSNCRPCCSDEAKQIIKQSCKDSNKGPNVPFDENAAREISYLKEEIKTLRSSLKELNTQHYDAMETADSHWVELEREYKAKEQAYRTKELCLKQKINQLQDCLRDDSRAAAEKIQQLEESEHRLKLCLVRLTKEHRDLMEQKVALAKEVESRAADEQKQQPLATELESERRRNQTLTEDLNFTKKLQQSMEEQLKAETDCLRQQIYDLKKDFMNTEVTNGELKEEVNTLETKIAEMEKQLKACGEHACCLEDELRTKDELVQRLEKKLGVCPEGFSLAQELYDSPEKRIKREEIDNLETASQGLGCALRDLERRERELPTHKDFQTIACSVKQLADTILHAQKPSVSDCECEPSEERPPIVCRSFEVKGIETKEKVVKLDSAKTEDITDALEEEAPRSSKGSKSSKGSRPSRGSEGSRSSAQRTSGGGLTVKDRRRISHIAKPLKQIKEISEVPTKKRKLVKEPQRKNLLHKRKQCKRFISCYLFRSRVRRTGASCRPINGKLPKTCSLSSFHSVTSVHTAHSSDSGNLTRAQYVKIVDPEWDRALFDGYAQTEPICWHSELVQATPQMCDEQLQTDGSSTQDCGVQADNAGVEARLLLLPGRTRAFLRLLQESIKCENESDLFRARVLQLWEGSEEFREHIELLQNLCTEQTQSPNLSESYDVFVAVLGCVRALKFALKPGNSQLLQQLEQRINERLIDFHYHKVESEFYCTIYYPVERHNTLKFGEEM
ncbi:centrosome-associated protein CEP250-like isoform X4 [Drosophila hydei]|uniref:Centrosome-associated protein CEP250-like isoform X4 n=1 Tax=Drosophila hydei TaxID=7224 RepID=A0A6J1LZY0_DROHY|nr:centrosome-associated protein CEP250-like isoform X4 [Drosophila hydei]